MILRTLHSLGLMAGLYLMTATAYAQDDAAAACQTALENQESEFSSINARNPDPNATIPNLQVVLYMTSERLSLLDQYCTDQPQYSMYESTKASHESAMKACTAIATSTSDCVATLAW